VREGGRVRGGARAHLGISFYGGLIFVVVLCGSAGFVCVDACVLVYYCGLWCYVILRVVCGAIALVTITLGVVFVVYFCVRCLLGVVRGWFGFYPVCGCGCCVVTVLLWVLEVVVVL